MPISAKPHREVIEQFAELLTDVRQAAGRPSYREMADRSGCISHTTLHEAAAGRRLPTWETTEQFLLACRQDPSEWKAEWERADRLQWLPLQVPTPEPATESRPGGECGLDHHSPSQSICAPDARRYVLAGAFGAAAVLAAEAAVRITLRN